MGFEEIRVVERKSIGLADLARYPLFAPDFIELLRRLTRPERHAELVFSIVVTARKPPSAPLARPAVETQTS